MGEWTQGPEWGVTITLAAYAAALLLRKKLKWLHPLFSGSAAVIAMLLLSGVSYEQYRVGGDLVLYMLGPATIALGVPLYKHARRVRRQLGAIALGVAAGTLCSIASSWALASMLGVSGAVTYSLLPKSVTTAVSAPLAEALGGLPELTAIFTVLTGLAGSMFGPLLLRLAGVRTDLAIGAAIGSSSHGIGTAKLAGESEWQGSVSALAMCLSCIITPLFFIPLYFWLP